MYKCLWAAMFFKSRALAARACELGRIQSNGQLAKPAREVRIGDKLNVTNEGGVNFTYRLLKNISGLWLIQQCRRAFEARKAGDDVTRILVGGDEPSLAQTRGRAGPVTSWR